MYTASLLGRENAQEGEPETQSGARAARTPRPHARGVGLTPPPGAPHSHFTPGWSM